MIFKDRKEDLFEEDEEKKEEKRRKIEIVPRLFKCGILNCSRRSCDIQLNFIIWWKKCRPGCPMVELSSKGLMKRLKAKERIYF